eukprot:m.188399 g.188399  ORF g.188399 m.188399 type:complete len:72 (-) comp10557_c0_seq21:610-825(-)
MAPIGLAVPSCMKMSRSPDGLDEAWDGDGVELGVPPDHITPRAAAKQEPDLAPVVSDTMCRMRSMVSRPPW